MNVNLLEKQVIISDLKEINLPMELHGNYVLEWGRHVDKNIRWKSINTVQTGGNKDQNQEKLSAITKSRKAEEWSQMEDPE